LPKLIIFLGNKAISCDTIVPIALAINNINNKKKIIFYCFNKPTYNFIIQNTVLYSAIKKVAKLKRFGGSSSESFLKYFYKIYWAYRLFLISINGLLFKDKFIHFGALEKWPLRIISYLNPSNVIYLEANCWGWNKRIYNIADINRKRNHSYEIRSANLIAGFSKDWPTFSKNKKIKKVLLSSSRTWDEWESFISYEGEEIWKEECLNLKINKDDRVVLFILGWLGPLDFYEHPESGIILLENTLKIISKTLANTSILLKPHPTTDISLVKKIIKKNNYKNIYITNLHSGLLAKKSLFAICNYFSTASIDVFKAGVKTIEYSNYSKKALTITNFQSMRPEYVNYFIQLGSGELEKIIHGIKNKKKLNIPKTNYQKTIQDKNFIDILSK
jgi:hypothetical protein